MNATGSGSAVGAFSGGIPLNVTLHAWPVPKLQAEQKQFNQTDAISVRNSESAKNLTTRLHNLNATGYVAIDEEVTDTGECLQTNFFVKSRLLHWGEEQRLNLVCHKTLLSC